MNDSVDDSGSKESGAPLPSPASTAAPNPSPSPSPIPPPAAAAPRRSNGVGWLALLVAAGALGAVAFTSYRDSAQRDLDEFRLQSSMQEQVLALNALQRQLSDQRADARSDRERLQQRIDEQRTSLMQQEQRLAELVRVDRSAWQLAEAEYLLQLASQRLLLGGDPASALRMLQQADAILAELDDNALMPVRAALADEVAALKAMPTIDVAGIYLALDAAAKRARQLQLVRPLEPPAATDDADQPAPESSGWSERLQVGLRAAARKLFELVQVRRHDEPYRALLAPEHEAALRHNLQLLFEQAQLALLAGNQTLYERSLSKSRDWLLTYFTIDQADARALADSIEELRQRPVTVTPPDIGESRRLLKGYQEQRLRVGEPAPANPAPTAAEPQS